MYEAHFDDAEVGREIYKTILSYYRESHRTLKWCALASGVVFFVCAFVPNGEMLKLLLVSVASVYIIYIHFSDESARRLAPYFNRSAEQTIAELR